MRQQAGSTFLHFVLGFTTFIAVSLGLTYVVSTYSMAQEKEKQVASAFQTMLGGGEEKNWWAFWE